MCSFKLNGGVVNKLKEALKLNMFVLTTTAVVIVDVQQRAECVKMSERIRNHRIWDKLLQLFMFLLALFIFPCFI